MDSGLLAFIIFAPIVLLVTYAVVGWLNYRENPLYWRSQLRMLEVGDVRWVQFSPRSGDGHTIAVVKEIGKKTIKFNRYIMTGGKYSLDVADMEYTIGDFYRFTDPEPVNEKERV